ncbi:MAG TPA: intradiol ring-cleavage dioxygenase [Geobacteraceae bacterium]
MDRPTKILATLTLPLLMLAAPGAVYGAAACPPTPPDEIGPFYRPSPPVRSKIGSGYVLEGTVRSSVDCRPIPGARIEVWQAGPNGTYDDAHRATLFADSNGRYRLETDFPPPYARRPSHVHILVDARDFEGLITQHYPRKGSRQARFDLVLAPEKQEPVRP